MTFFERHKQAIAFLGGLLTIVTTGMGATWVLSQRFERMQNELINVRAEVSLFEKDRYTLTMASETALRSAIENPGLRVVDPRNPSLVIMVRSKGVNDD